MGIVIVAAFTIWLAVCLWIALVAATKVKKGWQKALVATTIAAAAFLAPVSDELIGNLQYKNYCKEAEQVNVYGTIPVGLELYTPDGTWKLKQVSLPIQERNRLQALVDSLIRRDLGSDVGTVAPAAIPIRYRETRVFEVKTGKLLSMHKIYGAQGGWLSRLLFERGGWLVAPQCLPPLVAESNLNRTLLPFNGAVGSTK